MNAIQKYFKYRQSLIDQYVKGDMSKNEYLSRNMSAVLSLNIEPFRNIDTVEKGLFNYQYYNAMAKDVKKEDIERAMEFYRMKDRSTVTVLKLLDFTNISAYYIKVRSRNLKGRLVEILIHEHQMILHTASPSIVKMLGEEGMLRDGTQTSVIDGYINQKY